jgi:hypothetical protein
LNLYEIKIRFFIFKRNIKLYLVKRRNKILNKDNNIKNRKMKIKKVRLIIIGILFVVIGSLVLLCLTCFNRVYKKCVVEAGITIDESDLMKNEKYLGSLTEGSDIIDTSNPGEYTVFVKSGMFTYKSIVTVTDTIAPIAEIAEKYTTPNNIIEASDFVQNIEDVTKVSVQFKETPDYSQYGAQDITIVLTDAGNNKTELNSILYISRVEVGITSEVGSALPLLEEFLYDKDAKAILIQRLDETVDMNTIGDYKVVIWVNNEDYISTLHVVDTISPVVVTQDIIGYHTSKLIPEDFILSIEDVTLTTTQFVESPDYTIEGISDVSFLVTDASGNTTECIASVDIIEDVEPPVLSGVSDLVVKAGSSISYKKNLEVIDNCDKDILIDVDNTEVDLYKTGSYTITYTATDLAGNSSSKTATVSVLSAGVDGATETLVNKLADERLAKILTPEMTEYEKAEAIFFWVHDNVRYVDGTPKTGWVQGAYRGLAEQAGDCIVYAMTSKALLTRAGIKNMDIEKIPANTEHHWNLIDIGEGWYHFDSTRRKDGNYFFYVNDADILEYSDSHKDSHNYDKEIYTDIQ